MNSFLKKGIFVITFSLVGFFGFSPSQVDAACQVLSSTNTRPQTGSILNDYDDDNRPWIYLDVRTQDCVTAPSNKIRISFFDNGTSSNPVYNIQNTYVEIGQANALLMSPTQVDFQTSQSDFTIPILLGERGNGDQTGGYNFCGANPGEFDCQLWIKFFDINTNQELFNLGNQNGPYFISYEYDIDADTNWIVGGPGCSAGITPLPIGTICSNDNGIITNVTTPGAAGGVSSTGTYSTAPLAPLPGFSGDPDLPNFLESLFTIMIVIAGILALIMIIVGAVTYMTSDAFGKKEEGKTFVMNAIFGLVLALGSWVILNTINPELAENLSISIPTVSIDGATKEWNNGNAAPGTNIAPSATLNGQPITQGMAWPDDSAQRAQLSAAGISVSSSTGSNCTPTAGTPGCTSVYFDGPASGIIQEIINFRSTCGNCEIVITGGSEAWLHRTHGPNKRIVDMRATTSLNSYLRGLPGGPNPGDSFPSGQKINIEGVGEFYAERSGSNSNNTGNHWHVTIY